MRIKAGKWCLCLLIMILSSVAYAPKPLSISGEITENEVAVMLEEIEGRSLRVNLNDYQETSANRGHEPKPKPIPKIKPKPKPKPKPQIRNRKGLL